MVTSEPRSHDDYTIGWVCALPKEQTAARVMLDQEHPRLKNPPGDFIQYTLGSIGVHNVVIACLPKGRIGTISATNVATRMVATFPRIKLGLMVGIGGGIPTKVRLGDVVVSTPSGHFPGVVQWDMGKEKEKGTFERTGSLDNPPISFLNAFSTLETEQELYGAKFPEYLEALRTKWPRLVSKYLRSDSLEDVLFKTDYLHVKNRDSEDEEDDEKKCTLCERAESVKREPREARVHYGLIASGNRVIRDAIFRNKLNKDLGGYVLCVDMEAAGLMNNFPCVVIRGISDYADSHKNKQWQEHAAAVAAAYAKELLQYVQPDDVEREPLVKDTIDKIYNKVSKTEADVTQMALMAESKETQNILNWLTPKDYSFQHHQHLKTRQEGTGQWLLDNVKFRTWIKADKQVLFCPGMPGAGKTILAATVIDNLISRFENNPEVGVAYIYFNFWQQKEHEVEDLFASLLKQLAGGLYMLPIIVKTLYYSHGRKRTRPSFDNISKILQRIVESSYKRVFIVIDALDECRKDNNCQVKFIKELLNLQKYGAKIFVTSRSIPDITSEFNESIQLEIRASNEDICRYVSGQIQQRGSKILRKMQAEASTGIMKAVDGMFLLAKLDLDALLDIQLPRDIRTKLQNLPKGSKAYSHAYEGIMKRVEHQSLDSIKFAKIILSWVTCAKRPLTISELQHALAVEIGSRRLNREDLPQIQDIISVCAGLVTVDQGSDIIRLFHYTAQEYFKQTQERWFPDVEDDITKICITYLSFDIFFDTGCCSTDAAFEERLQSYQLYHYASHQWGYHARESSTLDQLVLDFLMKQANIEASSQALFAVKESGKSGYSQAIPRRTRGLHLAAYFGIEKAVQSPLDLYGWDPEDDSGRTPLSWAAENGHEAVVRLLISKGANPKATDHLGLTPLSRTTKNGQGIIMQRLDTISIKLSPKPNLLSSEADIQGLLNSILFQPVFLFDDSNSMKSEEGYFDRLKEHVRRLTRMTSCLLPIGHGVMVRCINQNVKNASSALSYKEIEKVLEQIKKKRGGDTTMGTALRSKILKPMVYKTLAEKRRLVTPMLIFIFIGGQPSGENKLVFTDTIIECVNRLEKNGYPRRCVQFAVIQIGTSKSTAKFLKNLWNNTQLEGVLYCFPDTTCSELFDVGTLLEHLLLRTLLEPITGDIPIV